MGATTGRGEGSQWVWLLVSALARGYLAFLVALAACVALPMLTGLSASVVQSGSMLPLVSEGDAVLVRELPPDAPTPMGRVVTFEAPEGSARTGLVLHRIVATNRDGTLVTAGDANADTDSAALHREDILGTATLLVPLIGLPTYWMATGRAAALTGWLALTAIALAVEVLNLRAETRTHRRRVDAHPHATLRPAVLALWLVAASIGATVAAPAAGGVDAVFTGRTSAVGSTWRAAVLAPATRLAFSTQPSGGTGGIAFATQPVVAVLDTAGGTVTGTRTVTLALTNAAGATLTCAARTQTGATGRFSFSGCAIDRVGNYTLTASSSDALTAATSVRITVAVGPAVGLRFTAVPTTTRAAAVFAIQPAVGLVDAGGNPTASTVPVTLVLTSPTGAVLRCTANPTAATGGTATFAGCRIDLPGTYSLTATAPGMASATSTSFVVFGPAVPVLRCDSTIWMATFSWTPTPYVPTVYRLYVNGLAVPATGADGWNSYVQLTSNNVPASRFAAGPATVEVRQVLGNGKEAVIGTGTVLLGQAGYRTYRCG